MARRPYLLAVKTVISAAFVLLLSASGCAKNPATGKPTLSLVSRSQEIQMGQQAVQEVKDSIGLVEDPALQSYVDRVGHALASHSERPELPWYFAVVDDPSVNAFALPGGKVFATRGLLTHMTNEAQLAAVLGHEIGHVTARHAVQRLSQQELIQLGLGVSMAVSDKAKLLAPLANAALSVLFLKFSRNDENQADMLGVRYAGRADYDVRQMVDVFHMLDRVSQQSNAGRLPEWLATHPDPQNRIQHVEQLIPDALSHEHKPIVDRGGYLHHLEGVVFGEDPRKGYVRDDHYYQPQLDFSLAVAQGWKTQDTPEAFIEVAPQQDGLVQLSAGPSLAPEQALQSVAKSDGVQLGRALPDLVPAMSSASAEITLATQDQGELAGIITFIAYGGRTYQVLAVAPQGALADHLSEFQHVIGSFQRIEDPSLRNVQPARINVIAVPADMTLQALYTRQPASISLERLALLNQMQPATTLKRGQLVKWVRGGTAQSESAPVQE